MIDGTLKLQPLSSSIFVAFDNRLNELALITACNAQNKCWPFYGAVDSLEVPRWDIKIRSVDTDVVDHLLLIVATNTYPAACRVSRVAIFT